MSSAGQGPTSEDSCPAPVSQAELPAVPVSPVSAPHRQPVVLLVGVVLLLVGMLASTGYSLWRSHLDHQSSAEQRAQTLVRVLDESIEAHIHEIDLTLQGAADEFRRLDAGSSASRAQAFTTYLARQQQRLPYLSGVRASDAQGNVRYGAGLEGSAAINQSEREHFQRARDEGGLVIARPVFARIAGQWVMPISRPLQDVDGRFAGVVYASIPLRHFEELFESLQLGRSSAITLFDRQRSIMIRYPELKGPGSAIGLKVGSSQFLALFEAGRSTATYQARSTTDGIWRTYSYRRVGPYPVYIMVGLARQDTLAEWYREAWTALAFQIGLFASVGLLAVLLRRSWRQREEAIAALSVRDVELSRLMVEAVQSERDLKSVLDNLPAMVGYWDRELRCRFSNRTYHDWYGLAPGQMRGKSVREVLGEALYEQSRAYIEAALQGVEQRYERASPLADGRSQYLLVHYIPDRVDGEVCGFYVLASDITMVKEAQAALQRSEDRYRRLFSESKVPMLLIDPHDGTIVDSNTAAASFYGYAEEQLRLMRITDINQLSTEQVHREMALADSQRRDYFLFPHRLASGAVRQVEVRSGPIEINGRRLLFSIIHDVTDRVEAEARLHLAASVYATSQEGIVVTDADNRIIDINPAFTSITGYSREDVLGRNPKLLSSGRHGPVFYAELWRALNDTGQWRGEVWNRRKTGEVYAQLLSISTVGGDAGEPRRYVGVFSDINPLKQHEAELDRIAHYDPLTGVPNRRLLTDRLEQAVARATRGRKSLAVCYLDLDGFKPVNDQYGHEAGDHLLVEIAHRLQESLRADDTLARLGGDEFVLLLNDLEQEQECYLALDRVLAAVSAPMLVAGNRITLSASIGVALFPQDDADVDTLLRHADQAMYRAKEAGKNRYHLYTAEQDLEIKGHQERMRRLDEAHRQGEFRLHYQPKVNLVSGEVIGAEALIRWQHPERGLLAPVEFLHYLTHSELGIAVGEWVIETALDQLVAWKQAGLKLSVSVNIDANHLQRTDFAERLRAALKRHPQVHEGDLELEILESVAINDLEHASRTLLTCQSMGVNFSLDDFGTGYSSLTYFRKLPVSTLKIDQGFVRGMLDDPEDLSIVESVVKLAGAFNRPVLAEGVESLEHGAMLVYLGCQLAQGYGIARPMPPEDLPGWLGRWQGEAVWRDLAQADFSREDVVLMVAASSHRAWVDRLVEHLASPECERPPIHGRHCRFGRWYHGSGQVRYAELAEFTALEAVHEDIHVLAAELVALADAGQTEAVQCRLPELFARRDSFLGGLERLFERLATRH